MLISNGNGCFMTLLTLIIPLAARFAQQSHILDADVVGHGLAHVVDGESGHGDGCECLHLDASLSLTAHSGDQLDTLLCLQKCGLHSHR